MIQNDNGFDPLAWANLQGNGNECFAPHADNKNKVFNTQVYPSDLFSQVRDVADKLIAMHANIAEDYDDWFHLGMALADGLGEDGRTVFHDLSRMSTKYNSTDCDKKYTDCMHGHGHGITINTYFDMAKRAGIDLGQVAREHMTQQPLSAATAITPSAKEAEKVGKNTIMDNLDNEMADGGLAEVAETTASTSNNYTFSDKLDPNYLPTFLRAIYDMYKNEPAKCDAMLIGSLNVVSGLMGGGNGTSGNRSGVYGIYDGRRVFAPLFNIVYSGAGNDKGSLIFCKMLAHSVKAEMRRKYEAEKQQYEEELAAYEAKNKKERGNAPKEPVYRDPFVPGNSSSSAVYRAMDANGGWGMMCETEADTISCMIDSDYGNYSDLMRKAHHHESLSMNRVTDKIHIDIDEPRLSIFLTCTPGQLPALFPSFENGLGSRFLFYFLPDEEVRFHDVFALNDSPLEDTYKKLGDQMLILYHAMLGRQDHPVQFVMSSSQQREFLNIYGEILKEQFAMLGKGIRAFVFRIALECFRYAMILSTLRRLSDFLDAFDPSNLDQKPIFPEEENALVCDDRDFRVAMNIIECLINHTARVYAVMAKEDDNPFAHKGIKFTAEERKVYDTLPEGDFETKDFLEVAAKCNVPGRTAERMLGKFKNVYQIVSPVRRGVYNKPKNKRD